MICLTIDYCHEIEVAEARLKAGDRQLYCGECGGLWVWPEQCQHPSRLTIREFNAMVRRIEREEANKKHAIADCEAHLDEYLSGVC